MKLTKEECKEALSEIEDSLCELEETKTGIVVNCLFDENLETIKQLIEEHFSNPPLEWEELNKGYPIYDNDLTVYGWKFIYMIDKEYKQLLLIDEEGNVYWVNYEENRFYRKEVQE